MLKNKTVKLVICLIILIVIGLSLCSSMVYAATTTTKLNYARIVKNSNGVYENKNGYALNTGTNHPIFQIVSVNGNQTTGTNYFCLDASAGSTWNANRVGTAVDYDSSYDLVNNKSEISNLISTYSDIAKSNYYKQVLWLLDNMYVADSSKESISSYLAKAGLIKQDENTNKNDLGWYIDDNNQKHYIYAYYFDESKIKSANSNSIFANTSSDVYKQLYGNLDGKGGYYYLDDNGNMVDVILSADLIETVEQAAIWYFTNYLNNTTATTDDNSEYNCYTSDSATSILNWLRYSEDSSTSTLSWKLLSNKTLTAKTLDKDQNVVTQTINEGAMLQEQADILYNYLIDSANAAAKNGYTSTSTGTLKIEFSGNSSDEKLVEVGDNYKVGPLKVTTTGNTTITGITVTAGTANITSSVTLQDASGKAITTPTSGTNFYVIVPKSQATGNITVNTTATTTATEKRLWVKSTTDNSNAEQPLVEIEQTTKNLNDNITIPVVEKEKPFDLALRKVITKISDGAGNTVSILNENNLDATRKITIDNSTIPNTATYKHRKDPVIVKTNYVITYNLNIYNEGEVDGYPTEIVDQLPAGLQSTLGNTVTSANGNTYSVSYDSTTNKITLKLTSTSPKSIKAYDGNNLSRDTIEVTAKVTQKPESNGTTKHYLTNIAYISGEKDSSGKTITQDREGTESRPTNSPTQSASDLNSTDANSYKGNTNNQSVYNDTNNNYYYEGQEDDDDFEKVVVLPEEIDLALRKFITQVSTDGNFSNTSTTTTYNRTPSVDTSGLKAGTVTTATYNHSKTPVYLNAGDYVLYTLRVYNEGDLDCYASQITDYLPEYLDFVDSTDSKISSVNSKWTYDSQTRKVTTTGEAANAKTLLKAFDAAKDNGNGSGLSYTDVQIICKVNSSVASGKKLTNIAEITEYKDENGNEIKKDRDSTSNDLNYPGNPETYKDDEINKDYVPGQEDDDDFEKVIVKKTGKYDVILIKEDKDGKQLDSKATFEVNGEKKEVTGTLVVADDVEINSSNVNTPDTYTIKETIPPDEYCKFDGTITITANKTSTNSEYTLKDLDYKVIDSKGNDITTTKDANVYLKDGNIYVEVKDYQFDLALRKFITDIRGKEVTTRIPQVVYKDGKITYKHPKDVVKVVVGDVVTYTIRVFNEGGVAGYAETVTDDIPEYLEYLPDNDLNKTYRWKMYDKDGKETSKVSNAVKIVTDYTSKANGETLMKTNNLTENPNLLNPFDSSKEISDTNPDYVDVKVAFKVKDPNSNKTVITNKAQISEDADEDGNPIDDIDSIPDEWNDGEDDQDYENVSVEYFDLSLLKYVTKAIVTEDGKTTTTKTGNNGSSKDITPKVEIHRKKINKTVVKFEYTIKITNEGDIAGYAKEITDYVPKGLKFYAADNKNWKDEGNNVISTTALKNTLLQPGESATVTVVLRWINGEGNLNLKVNTAEISKDYNEKGVPDRDSTPDNQKKGEDDIDDAPVLLTIATGLLEHTIEYVCVALVILVVIGLGIVAIRKFVL